MDSKKRMKTRDLLTFIIFTFFAIFFGIRTYNNNEINFYLTTIFSLLLSIFITIWLIKNNPNKKKTSLKKIKQNNKKARIGIAIIMSIILYLTLIGILNLRNLEKLTSPIVYFSSLIFAITSLIALIKR